MAKLAKALRIRDKISITGRSTLSVILLTLTMCTANNRLPIIAWMERFPSEFEPIFRKHCRNGLLRKVGNHKLIQIISDSTNARTWVAILILTQRLLSIINWDKEILKIKEEFGLSDNVLKILSAYWLPIDLIGDVFIGLDQTKLFLKGRLWLARKGPRRIQRWLCFFVPL